MSYWLSEWVDQQERDRPPFGGDDRYFILLSKCTGNASGASMFGP